MKNFTYTGLIHRAMDIYKTHGSAAAYHFVCENIEDGQANPAQMYNLQYSLAASCGNDEQAMKLLTEAVQEHGYWYSPDYLLEDEDLAVIREQDEFQQIVDLCREREANALAASTAKLHIVLPDEQHLPGDFPTVFVMHGELENNNAVEPVWSPLLEDGYKLALLQSSQIQFSEAYDWVDIDQGMEELEQAMLEVSRVERPHSQQAADQTDLPVMDGVHTSPEPAGSIQKPVLAGFSSGARVALNMAAAYPAAVNGVMLISPWLPDPEEWENALNSWNEHQTRLYIVCGERDEECLPGVLELVEALKHKQIPYTLHNLPGLEHNYPVHFTNLLHEAASWFRSSSKEL